MKRLNAYQFYTMGMSLHPLTKISEGVVLKDWAYELYNAKWYLNFILGGGLPGLSLVVSRAAALELFNAIAVVMPGEVSVFPNIDPGKKLDFYEAWQIKNGVESFEKVFAAEIPTVDTYIVSQKGIYSTADLIERAEYALDEACRSIIPKKAIDDFRQAGRCLAFDLPTAAGFHSMRATEAVLREYWTVAMKPDQGTEPPMMAQCIDQLRAAKEDVKVMDILDHVKDLHRNTLMHPDVFLTSQESLRLFDISKSAISAMSDRMAVIINDAPTS